METFSTLLAICAGNSPVTGELPSQRPVTRSFGVFFDLREAGDLKRHRAHYDVTVMHDSVQHHPSHASNNVSRWQSYWRARPGLWSSLVNLKALSDSPNAALGQDCEAV